MVGLSITVRNMMEKIKSLEEMDDVQFIANSTLNSYVRNKTMSVNAGYDHMAILGAEFILEEVSGDTQESRD